MKLLEGGSRKAKKLGKGRGNFEPSNRKLERQEAEKAVIEGGEESKACTSINTGFDSKPRGRIE